MGDLYKAIGFTFGYLVAAGFGLPLPEELGIVGAGIWVAQAPDQSPHVGEWRWLLLPVCILGVVVSDGLLYWIGRRFGPRLMEYRWMRRLLPAEKHARIERNFQKYGVKILLFARLLPGIRSPIFITAGLMRLPLRRFLLADGIYAIPGVSLIFFLSFWFTDRFQSLVQEVTTEIGRVRDVLILVGIAAVAVYFLYHFLRKPVSTGDPNELPIIGHQVAATITGKSPALNPEQQKAAPSANGADLANSPITPHAADSSSKPARG